MITIDTKTTLLLMGAGLLGLYLTARYVKSNTSLQDLNPTDEDNVFNKSFHTLFKPFIPGENLGTFWYNALH